MFEGNQTRTSHDNEENYLHRLDNEKHKQIACGKLMICCKPEIMSRGYLGSVLVGVLLGCGRVCAQIDTVQLTFQGSWTGIVSAAALQVSSNYAYLADGVADLQIIDISAPTNPIATGSFVSNVGDPNSGEPGFPASDVQVRGDLAYVADNYDGLHVLDVSDPAHPVALGDALIGSLAVQVVDNLAYVGVVLGGSSGPFTQLNVLDVSNPTNPISISSFGTQSPVRPLAAENHYLLVAIGKTIQLLDVFSRTNPIAVGSLSISDFAQSAQVVTNFAYIAAGAEGLLVLDISDPSRPTKVADYPAGGNTMDVCLVDGYAYIADSISGLVVLDVTNPTNALQVGQYQRPGCRRVRIIGTHAYLASAEAGLEVLEINLFPYISGVLRNGNSLELTWRGATGLKLQSTTSLTNPTWSDVPGSDGQSRIDLPIDKSQAFYRLVKQ